MAFHWDKAATLAGRIATNYGTGKTVTIGSLVIDGVIEGTMNMAAAAERWGQDNTYAFSLTFERSKLTAGLPEVRSTVTYRGTVWRIIGVVDSITTGTVQLQLGDKQ